ncbi:acyl-CoA dehydrogenase [Allomuricauda sp. NBRC 101325]|uniref:acyl-CoA dehydrogenase n=1 Tax=Allomuricauda sp. NBRC 101325 TaxID=1113758 RepID=UPI0024A53D46|nr:acyl-CoA dehydrogenase [Muricauda sp. NBRC 101325]GLU45412.1 hypothetical protein Musp01_30360 [Muricauda sp. NBRC 101325]
MDPLNNIQQLCFGKKEFSKEVLDWIDTENLWNLWVPQEYGGLEMSLTEGLKTLHSLAQCDGSLGWTVTLCSGANFFIGNLKKDVADQIFLKSEKAVRFGGSGGAFGTAEKMDDGYVINGHWKYATGAPYLTHFTLNAKIQEGGEDILLEDGTPLMRSFVLRKKDVELIRDWNAMGLRATVTDSFAVRSKWVDSKYSFVYDEFYLPQPIFKIPFSVFADLTLWVNYLGMADHFLKEAQMFKKSNALLNRLQDILIGANYQVMIFAKQLEYRIEIGLSVPIDFVNEIHHEASRSIRAISKAIIEVFPFLGIRGITEGQTVNQIFRDYFTATQHHNFHEKLD